jgi:Tfp pilus assembly protein PilF
MKKSTHKRDRLFKVILVGILLSYIACSPANLLAQENSETSGTLNRDYFWAASQNNYWRGLATSDTVTHHIKPAANWFARGDYVRAKRELNFTLDRFVNHPQALMVAGMVSRESKDYAWGLAKFQHALRLYPQYALTHAQYGKFLVDMGELQGGIQRLKHALEMDPKLPAGYEWLAEAYTKMGETDLARETREQARSLGLSPKSADR